MFTKILIANRGDQPHHGAATQSNCLSMRSMRRLSRGGTAHV